MTVAPKKSKPVHVGLSVTQQSIELAVFSPKNLAVEQAVSLPVPEGLFDVDGDRIQEPQLLKEVIAQALRGMRPKPTVGHLSLPGTLLRMVGMPKMDPAGLYVSLSSEAE